MMSRVLGTLVVAAGTWLLLAGVLNTSQSTRAEGPQVTARPEPATGTVRVIGDVRVVNQPAVEAQQSGRWVVGVEGETTVQGTVPAFVRPGRVYAFTFAGGAPSGSYRIDALGPGPWVRAVDAASTTPPADLWLNTSLATSIREP